PLARPERGRRRDVEAHLDLGVGRVRVLAAGPARRGEPPLQLVERERTAARDAENVHRWRLRRRQTSPVRWRTAAVLLTLALAGGGGGAGAGGDAREGQPNAGAT